MASMELPIGLGGAELNRERRLAPALPVDNKVLWVNKEVELPFRLEEGSRANIGLFLTAQAGEEIDRAIKLENNLLHGRSALLGRIIFKDKSGRLYRDIDLKGVGCFESESNRVIGPRAALKPRGLSDSPRGICLKEEAIADRNFSEYFLKNGLRTCRVLAILELKKIAGDDEVIPVALAKKRGYMKKNEKPVIEVRGWVTKARIDNALDDGGKYIRDAISLVAQEIGINPAEFTIEAYLEWFARTLGEQVGRLHKLGFTHNNLIEHNITLDCRIIDFDTVRKIPVWGDKKGIEFDRHWARRGLRHLIQEIGGAEIALIQDDYEELFQAGYKESLRR